MSVVLCTASGECHSPTPPFLSCHMPINSPDELTHKRQVIKSDFGKRLQAYAVAY